MHNFPYDKSEADYWDLVNLVGNRYVHSGNLNTYEVTGIVWLGEQDLWGIEHIEIIDKKPGIKFVRSHLNFFGEREPGVLRFKERGAKQEA